MFYRYHDLKRMEREQRLVAKQSASSSSSSPPPVDDLGTNEFRPDGVDILAEQKQAAAMSRPIPRVISFEASQEHSSSAGRVHTVEHSLKTLHVTKKRRKSEILRPIDPYTEPDKSPNDSQNTHRQRKDDRDSSCAAGIELIFDEDPVINKILSELYHDFLTKSSADGSASSLSYDDKILLESASTGAAFDAIASSDAGLDGLPTAFRSRSWIV